MRRIGDRFGAADSSRPRSTHAPYAALARSLPFVVLATIWVAVLPAAGVAMIIPAHGLDALAVSLTAAMLLSFLAARVGEAVWMRRRRPYDLLFADLMIWGWVRRCWTERRLSNARRVLGESSSGVRIDVLQRLGRLLEARDAYTYGHSRRVARHADMIARALHLPAAEVAKIRTAAAVHDVGKLYTPPEVLNKPGRLTDPEYWVMQQHAADGAWLLGAMGDQEIVAMVRHHHERLDGKGYPDGLAGDQIPLGARIIAVADTFDAMTSGRSYRTASPHKRALDVLDAEAGIRLDADVVAAFVSHYGSRRSAACWAAAAVAMPGRLLELAGRTGQTLAGGVPVAGTAALVALAPALGIRGDAGAPATASRASAGAVRIAGLPTRSAPSRSASAGATTPASSPHRHHARTHTQPDRPRPTTPRRTTIAPAVQPVTQPVTASRDETKAPASASPVIATSTAVVPPSQPIVETPAPPNPVTAPAPVVTADPVTTTPAQVTAPAASAVVQVVRLVDGAVQHGTAVVASALPSR